MANAKENLMKYAELHHAQIVLLMGMKVQGNDVSRDLGLVNVKNQTLFDAVLKDLNSSDLLELHLRNDVDFLNGIFFEQKNVAASRKQVLPIIKQILDNWK